VPPWRLELSNAILDTLNLTLYLDLQSKEMADKTKHTRLAVRQCPHWEMKRSVRLQKEIGLLLLSISILLCVVLYRQPSYDDAELDHSIWNEVYMPNKFGLGVIAKRNISVCSQLNSCHLSTHLSPERYTYSTRESAGDDTIGGEPISTISCGANRQVITQEETGIHAAFLSRCTWCRPKHS
jgi:hypothetical protein